MDDPRLDPLYRRLIQRHLPLIVHAGRQPEPSEHVGAAAFGSLMRKYPNLLVIVAHMGADEFDRFFGLCDRYEGIYMDTCMVFNNHLGGPPAIERVVEHQDRILYGSDFPHIPYRLETAVQAIRDLQLGRAIEQKLFYTNAARLIGLPPDDSPTD
jgi:predicted TIM-barrel fold metal-dependent hydrolase